MLALLTLTLLTAASPELTAVALIQELAAKDATWNDLRLKPDVPGLDRLLVDDWKLTHSDGRVQTKAEYLAELKSRTRANQAIRNEDVEVRLYGETGVVTGASIQSGVTNGQPFSGHFRFTRVWIRHAGAWRMVASHSSRIETPR
ncbi:MAG: nuclear transport factor 2 family protein [Vicinamibacteria bacterium]|nr:nuclear transport factor 2 family protein [Vicinamibacteria bacterium]